jgi:hypothetical protein
MDSVAAMPARATLARRPAAEPAVGFANCCGVKVFSSSNRGGLE